MKPQSIDSAAAKALIRTLWKARMTISAQSVSIVVPAYNEAGNVRPLVEAVDRMFRESGLAGELLLIDDGSTDDTRQTAEALVKSYDFLRVIAYRPNRGLTYALETGFKAAAGDILVFYPADLQYDPADIPRLVARVTEGCDIVTGWKQGDYSKKRISAVYNWLCRTLFRIHVHDLNSVKAFRKAVVDCLDFRPDFHRYMVIMAVQAGFTAGEVKIPLHERRSGTGKFDSPWRILVGFLDLVAVWFHYTFLKKPMLFFGTGGLLCLILGGGVGLAAVYMRYVLNTGFRPLLTLVSMLVSLGVTLFALGFLGESVQELHRRLNRIEERLKQGDGS